MVRKDYKGDHTGTYLFEMIILPVELVHAVDSMVKGRCSLEACSDKAMSS